MLSIAVVGATGFIGSEICRLFSQSGWRVLEFSRNHANQALRLDLRNKESFNRILSEGTPDVVLTTAWETSHGDFWTSSRNLEYSDATLAFAEFCMQRKVKKFVALGSMSEYGFSNRGGFSSSYTHESADTYSIQKRRTHEGLQALSELYEVPFQWLRIFQAFGKNEKKDRLLPSMITSLRNSEVFQIQTPRNVLDWIHVEEIANAVLWTICEIKHSVIDIGTSKPHSVKNIAELICHIHKLDSNLIQFKIQDEKTVKDLVVSTSSPLFVSGWKEEKSIEERLASL